MRINKLVAQATGLSRRAVDQAIRQGRVAINYRPASLGDEVAVDDSVTLDNQPLIPAERLIIMLNKPTGYVCSRKGQGNRTIYNLLPPDYHQLKPIGRLDKDSSGLILLTNDGQLANQLTHPRYAKTKVYEITLDKPLTPPQHQLITDPGIRLEDGLSRLELRQLDTVGRHWQISMSEGRNRQIRRTFAALDYTVKILHRNRFGPYRLGSLPPGQYMVVADLATP